LKDHSQSSLLIFVLILITPPCKIFYFHEVRLRGASISLFTNKK
jgi:hypothetical protein